VKKWSLINGQLSFVIFGCAFGAAIQEKTARSASTDDKRQLTINQ